MIYIQQKNVIIDEEYSDQRLDNFLLRLYKKIPKSHIYKSIRTGQIRINKKRVDINYRLRNKDLIRIPPIYFSEQSDKKDFIPVKNFPVIFEDSNLLVIDKPAGQAVHGGSGISFGIIEQIRHSKPEDKFLELVHRLDRDTSGLLMIAKKRKFLLELQNLIRERKIKKHYFAIVFGGWKNIKQHVRLPLKKYLTNSGERRVKADENGVFSHTVFTLVKNFGEYSFLDIEIITGRTHQIRVHLSELNFPILGDQKYGNHDVNVLFQKNGFPGMFLHAYQIKMKYPLTEENIILESSIPEKFQRLIDYLNQK